MGRKLKKVGKCHYCKDAIYDFQEVCVSENDKKHYYHHNGCYRIAMEEKNNKLG